MFEKYTWIQDEMTIIIKCDGHIVMQISMYEAMESAGYHNIMRHVKECNRTPWLKRWQRERMEETFATIKDDHK